MTWFWQALPRRSPRLDLSNALEGFDGSLIDSATQLRELCARRLGLDISSLLVLGRGGVPVTPEDRQPSVSERNEVGGGRE